MRINSLDSVRGFAIFIMIIANSFPYIYPYEDCPLSIRLIFSTAAPIFIIVSGISLRLAEESGKRKRIINKRAIQILFIAIIIDVLIWGIAPFFSMDVLYLISFSLSILILINNVSDKIKLVLALIILSSSFIINRFYNFEMIELSFYEIFNVNHLGTLIHRIFLDGWFPIMPWLAFSILGYLSCKYRLVFLRYSLLNLILGGILIVFYIIILKMNLYEVNNLRDGYTEIFYPVTYQFLFFIFGIHLCILFFLNHNSFQLNQLSLLGKFSLPVYLIHTLLIKIFMPIYNHTFNNFSVEYLIYNILILLIIVFTYAYILHNFAFKIRNKQLRFLIGL